MTFVLVGASLACVWAVFLATQHALGGFLDYYTVFVGDHNATGARNVSHTRSGFPVFVILVSVTLVCVLWLGHRVVSHRKMSDREWVLAASTLFAGLYAEKALGRFDYSHIYESFFSALPMMIIGGALCLEWADGRVAAFLKTAPGKLSDQAGVASRHVLHLRGASVSALLALLLVPPAVAMGTQIPSHNKVALSSLHSDPLVGYDAGGHRIVHTARSLERVVNQLDPQGPVFDFGNAPGYVHFLLQRDPSTRFTNMGLALTPPAQELLLQELRADPPRLVVFDAGTLGASRWDSISNDVRTYRVAQYLLDGWTPIRSVDGFLVMLRNDLLGTSTATTVPSHADRAALYSSTPACLWGYSANYLSSPPQGGSLTLPLRPVTSTVRGRTSVAIVPKDVRLADYALATFTAPGPIGHAHVVISDKADQAPWHEIRFRVLPFSGARASVRVGSCLQWHGYGTRRLYVTQTHGRPLTSIMLSGVG